MTGMHRRITWLNSRYSGPSRESSIPALTPKSYELCEHALLESSRRATLSRSAAIREMKFRGVKMETLNRKDDERRAYTCERERERERVRERETHSNR